MSRLLHPRFLTNAKQYAAARAVWKQLWHEVLTQTGQVDSWKSPWLTPKHADGTPYRDGNPIFSAVNETDRLGVRIIQEAPMSAGPNELDYWVDTFGSAADPNKVRELVISTVLDEGTRLQARELLACWVARGKLSGACKSGLARSRR